MEERVTLWQEERNKRKSTTIFFVAVLVLFTIVVGVYYLYTDVYIRVLVKGSSMENTLKDGDVVTVNTKKEADYGDIIVISDDESSGWIIKRLIAKGGDEVMISQGYVFVNGEKLVEPYIKEEGSTYYPECTDKNHLELLVLTVPKGEIFFLGDNRKLSSDSRNPLYGTVSVDNVVGVVTPFHLKVKNLTKKIVYLTSKDI